MERLGCERQEQTKMVQYTFLNELIEDYSYIITRDRYLLLNSGKKVIEIDNSKQIRS